MYTFSPENQLVIAACSPNPDSGQLLQTLAKIENWEKAGAKLIKKEVALKGIYLAEQLYPKIGIRNSIKGTAL